MRVLSFSFLVIFLILFYYPFQLPRLFGVFNSGLQNISSVMPTDTWEEVMKTNSMGVFFFLHTLVQRNMNLLQISNTTEKTQKAVISEWKGHEHGGGKQYVPLSSFLADE